MFFVLAGGALWGCISLFVRALHDYGLSTMEIVALRSLFSLLFLALYMILKGTFPVIRLKDSWMFIGTGIMSLSFFNWAYFTVIERSEASVAVILLYTSPIWILLFSAFLFKEAITKSKVLALILTFLGACFITGIFHSQPVLTLPLLLIGLSSGLGYGLYSIFGRYALRRYDSLTITFYTFLFSSFSLLPVIPITETTALLWTCPPALMMTAGIALFCTVLPYLFYTKGLTTLDTGKAAIIATIEPIVASLIGFIVYDEALTFSKIMGMACILFGIWFMNKD